MAPDGYSPCEILPSLLILTSQAAHIQSVKANLLLNKAVILTTGFPVRRPSRFPGSICPFQQTSVRFLKNVSEYL